MKNVYSINLSGYKSKTSLATGAILLYDLIGASCANLHITLARYKEETPGGTGAASRALLSRKESLS